MLTVGIGCISAGTVGLIGNIIDGDEDIRAILVGQGVTRLSVVVKFITDPGREGTK